MTPARDISATCFRLAPALGRIAFRISEMTFAKVISAISRRFGITYQEAELLVIDVEREHEKVLYAALRDRLALDDALDAVRRCLGDDQ